MIYDNLIKSLIEAADAKQDSRWRRWAKVVEDVDKRQSNGFCFLGDFIANGTVEISNDKPLVVLLATTDGSRRYQTITYNVLVIHPDGRIEKTGITTDDNARGWALRIRDRVAELLVNLAQEKQDA